MSKLCFNILSNFVNNILGSFYDAILILIIFIVLRWLFVYFHTYVVINKINGPKPYLFLGNILNIRKKYGTMPVVILHKADYLDYVEPWLGKGLLTSTGEKWAKRRKLITPSFHFEILNDFLQVMNEQAEIMTDVLTKLAYKGEDIDIFRRIGLCTLDIICETAMGQNINAQKNNQSEYVAAVARIGDLIFERTLKPWLMIDFIHKFSSSNREQKKCLEILHGFTKKVIREREAEFDGCNFQIKRRTAFLDLLLKAKNHDLTLTDGDIQEEVDTFMFEGHDTTCAAAAWACHLVGSHPEIQKKLHDEIDQIFGNSDRSITNADLQNLVYLECVIKETLRMFPSVPLLGRELQEDTFMGGFRIPKGTNCFVYTFMVHRDEKYFAEPDKFDPNRFLPENCKDRHPFAYIPFSAGRRNCIGQRFAMMEEKVILTNILRKFEIKSLKTLDELQPLVEMILKPTAGIPVRLKIRSRDF